MSLDDTFIPIPTPLRVGEPLLATGGRYRSLRPLSEFDLDDADTDADSGDASACGEVLRGDAGARSSTSRRPIATPSRRAGAPLRRLPKTSSRSERRCHFLTKVCRDDSCLHLRTPALCKENFPVPSSVELSSAMTLQELKDALPEKPKQYQPSGVAVSRAASRARYPRSKTGWASKERSTPEGYDREKHGWRFESPSSKGMGPFSLVHAYAAAFPAAVVVRPPKKKKSPEERNAIREKRIAQRERGSLRHIQTALRKYNNANNTKFELMEITVKCMFFEFGGGCYHYNFTAKPENHHSAGGGTTLFFAEINLPLRSADDVLLCSIVGERDAGHCHACKKHHPMMVHPSSRAYGGGNTTAICYHDEDSSSSDSDY